MRHEFPMLETVIVRLPLEQKSALRAIARQRGQTVSEILRETVGTVCQVMKAAA